MARERVIVRSHPDVLGHLPTLGHPEMPARVRAVLEGLQPHPEGWEIEPEAALPPDGDVIGVLRWLHDPALIERVRGAVAAGQRFVDAEDNPVSKGTWRAALSAAGLAVSTALDLVNGRLRRAFLALRPPGHHAGRNRAMGYCFFNNVALAAEVIARASQAPVLIVDFDVHHGNGTQALFWERPDVGYLSVHRYPFYPGSGAGDETGAGAGLGTTLNVPLAAGADDDTFAGALEAALDDLGRRLKPAAILVSAGFDAHETDPLGGMHVTDEGYRRMTRAIVQAADAWSQGRVLSVLEGGYDLEALASASRAHVEELARALDSTSPSSTG
ncbi:MAG: histone deacetylase [Acidobacteria bacterium]|nr:histone deacetylase [Acidobacteriota bacterium]